MPYSPPSGWMELRSSLERANVFHEDRGCELVAAELVPVPRPGRCRQCPACVVSTALADVS